MCTVQITCFCALILMISHVTANHRPQNLKRGAYILKQPVCGYWQDDYIRLHNRILEGEQPPRYAVAVRATHKGLADQLLGIFTTFVYALLTQRAFQISEGVHRHKMPLETVYTQPSINWTASLDYAHYLRYTEGQDPLPPKHTVMYHQVLDVHVTNWSMILKDWNGNGPETNKEEVVMLLGNRGSSYDIFQNQPKMSARLSQMGLREDTLFGCVINFLFELRPEVRTLLAAELSTLSQSSNLLQERENGCDSALASGNTSSDTSNTDLPAHVPTGIFTIGLQIRMGDNHFADSDANWQQIEYYFHCAQQVEDIQRAPGQRVVWYVVSDSKAVRSLAQQHYPNKILTTPDAIVQHTAHKDGHTPVPGNSELSLDGMRTAVGEHWALGMTDFQVGCTLPFFQFYICSKSHYCLM